ncbi:hypothetical protein [Azorhizobium oxalatiphilum]|nr:hypothetical protein [Azorhizobium oxalatiphilum]
MFGLLLLLIPFGLFALAPIWLTNPQGDWDVWMYYGYFHHLFQFSDHYIWPGNAYIGTRLAYFLPGHFLYLISGDNYYKLTFNIGVCYTAIILSFYYVVRTYMPLRVAVSVSLLLATDFYFLRSIGWDYVDKGVLTYEMLTLACLTAARNESRRSLMTVAAGFFATCMIFVHLASAIVFPLLFIYSGFVVQNARSLRDWGKHLLRVVICGTIGALIAQALFGTLMVVLHGGDFFFIMKQIGVVQANVSGWNAQLAALVARGYWITVPLAALVGAAVGLAAKRFRGTTSRFETFWLWAVVGLYGVMFTGEVTGKLWLLSRDGMHSTILAPFSMIAFGILLFRSQFRGMVAMTLVVFGSAFLVRVWIGDGAGLSRYVSLSMPTLGILMGLLLAASFAISKVRATIAAMVLIGLLSAFNPGHFADDRAVRAVHARIVEVSNGKLPSLFYDRADPQLYFIWSVLASFTDRALVTSRETYPTLRDGLTKGDIAVIAGSNGPSEDEARATLLKYARAVRTVATFENGGVRFHVFEVEEAQ